MAKGELTLQQERFCQEYVACCNATEAAIKAGYAKGSAASAASHLIKKPQVNTRIFQIRNELMGEIEITATRVLQEMAAIAFSNIMDYCEFDGNKAVLKDSTGITRQDLAAVQSVRETHTKDGINIYFQLYDKQKALEMLGRYLALFNDTMKLQTDKPIEVKLIRGGEDAGDG